ncbi:DUF6412 domain-containing protein [Actinomadura sp. 9N215]|uniref:DUF6412 domain-containing protein n=1 Tax=Actinomadura sp. 9N215 TaxID=3375150 RepID=UPI0037B1E520
MVWSLVLTVVLRGFAVTGWAGPGQPVLTLMGALTVAGLLAFAAGRAGAVRRGRRVVLAHVRTTLRERTLRTGFLPQRDPDAAGRPRPRAPGTGIAAA